MSKPAARSRARVTRPARKPLLRWVFQRRQEILTCEVAVGRKSSQVSIVPHRDSSLAVVEIYDRASDAVWRHAEITVQLRDNGWVVADHLPVAS